MRIDLKTLYNRQGTSETLKFQNVKLMLHSNLEHVINVLLIHLPASQPCLRASDHECKDSRENFLPKSINKDFQKWKILEATAHSIKNAFYPGIT